METRIPKNIEIVGIISPFYQHYTIVPILGVLAILAILEDSFNYLLTPNFLPRSFRIF